MRTLIQRTPRTTAAPQTELQLAEDRQREQVLQSYLDHMTTLLLDKGLAKPDAPEEVRVVARARTLATLRKLDGVRKGAVLQFLYDSDLVNEPPVIHLAEADLSQARLERAHLKGANLDGAILDGASLAGARLDGASLKQTLLSGANLERAYLDNANLTGAALQGASLVGAHLEGALVDAAALEEAHSTVASPETGHVNGAHTNGARAERALPPGISLKTGLLDGNSLNRAMTVTAQWRTSYRQSAGVTIPLLQRYPALLDVLEVVTILLILFMATQKLQAGALDHTRPPGDESAYLVNSGALAAETYQRFGAIPLWNPLMGQGEPLFESLFSYALNPFMTLPPLALGINDGVKAGILLHIVVMALGGWAMGRALKLHAGAVVMGLMLAASGAMVTGQNRGFYQIASSLAYMPWIYAGLFGLLYREHYRRWLGVFAVSLAMMLFAGTYWFVLPTGIGCGAIALVALVKPKTSAQRIERFRRLVTAGAFFLGFAALSLLPRLNSYLMYHPTQGLGTETYDLFQVFNSFFVPDKLTTADWWFAYEFLIPGWFALAVIIGRAVLIWAKSPFARWRILIPSALLILFFCVWAQGNTPLFHLLYDHTFFIQWRWPTRVSAAAAPFVVLIIALWFDEIVMLLLRLNVRLWIAALAVVGLGLYAASQSFSNWDHMFNFDPVGESTPEYQAMTKLRADHPDTFLLLTSEGTIPHIVVHDLWIRSTRANPDAFTHGLPAEQEFTDVMRWEAQYALAFNDGYRGWLRDRGYLPYPDAPKDQGGGPTLWYAPEALPYAFIVQRDVVDHLNGERLTSMQVDSVSGMNHHLDRIEFTVQSSKSNSILVVQEVDYPGWTVTVDGRSARITSFDGLMAVILPSGVHSVVFEYHSPLLLLGFIIYLITLVLFAGYLFHVDERIVGTRFDPTPRLRSLAAAVLHQLLPQREVRSSEGHSSFVDDSAPEEDE